MRTHNYMHGFLRYSALFFLAMLAFNLAKAQHPLYGDYDYEEVSGLFRNNSNFNLQVVPGRDFKNTLGIEAERTMAFSRAKVERNDSNLISCNNIAIKFFAKATDPLPTAMYVGPLRNGSADGYGNMFKLISLYGRQSLSGRRGFFKKGNYQHDHDDSLLVRNALANFDFRSVSPELVLDTANFEIVKSYHAVSLLNSDLLDGYKIKAKVPLNKEGAYAVFNIEEADFMSETVVTNDRSGLNIPKKNAAQKSKTPSLLGQITQTNYLKDEYTMVDEELLWDIYYRKECKEETNCLFCDNDETQAAKNFTIYTRKGPLDEWKQVGTWIIERVRKCPDFLGEVEWYLTNSKNGSRGTFSRPRFNSKTSALNDIIKEAQFIGGYPSDSLKAINHGNQYRSKKEMLLDRIRAAKKWQFNSQDSLAGAWLDDTNNKLIFLFSSRDKAVAELSLSYDALYHAKGYTDQIKQLYPSILNYSTIEYRYTETANLGNPITYTRYYNISKISKDQIEFEKGLIWKRVQ